MGAQFSRSRGHRAGLSAALKGNRRGITLVEVIIAVTILLIGALTLMAAQVTSAQLDRQSRETAMALNEARAMLEFIKEHPYDEIDAANFVANFDVSQGDTSLTPIEGEDQCGTIVISPEDADGMKEIAVTVRWRSSHSGERAIRLASEVSDHL